MMVVTGIGIIIVKDGANNVSFYNIEYDPQMTIDDIDYAVTLLIYEDDEILL